MLVPGFGRLVVRQVLDDVAAVAKNGAAPLLLDLLVVLQLLLSVEFRRRLADQFGSLEVELKNERADDVHFLSVKFGYKITWSRCSANISCSRTMELDWFMRLMAFSLGMSLHSSCS